MKDFGKIVLSTLVIGAVFFLIILGVGMMILLASKIAFPLGEFGGELLSQAHWGSFGGFFEGILGLISIIGACVIIGLWIGAVLITIPIIVAAKLWKAVWKKGRRTRSRNRR